MTRVGIGYDLHRLAEGRKLILGGIELVFHKGPVGHSDGDALAHALVARQPRHPAQRGLSGQPPPGNSNSGDASATSAP